MDDSGLRLLAADRRRGGWDVAAAALTDRPARGCVAARVAPGAVRRAEPGPAGPLLLQAHRQGGALAVEVWGPPATPAAAAEAALLSGLGWAGVHDELAGVGEVLDAHPVTRRLSRHVGEVRLSRLPRVGEALGRAVVAQLVQHAEARRSTAQLVATVGTPGPGRLWCWPTAAQLGAAPAWLLRRRCGLSLRGAGALHAGAVGEAGLARRVGDWPRLEARLLALPGVGPWTAAETRLALGDPDAIPVGDYNFPALVGHVLDGGPGDGPDGRWTDAGMLALLEPFAGQRGRTLRLIQRAVAVGAARRPPRRAPRAALSAHRYW